MEIADPDAIAEMQGPLSVAADAIHVWAYSLAASAECIERYRQWLSSTENDRAQRFIFARDGNEFVVAHGVLRRLLSMYCGVEPMALQFSVGPADKPSLETQCLEHAKISFNLTHSGSRALLAVSDGREIGVDLERVRGDIDKLSIARRFFFGTERDAIELAPPEHQVDVFFRYWVAKEAVLKAQGVGIRLPLDSFRVDFLPDLDAAGVTSFDPTSLSDDWTVRMLPCEAGWCAAVAARGNAWTLQMQKPDVAAGT
jgi:4'-phosphopantetheinyl transferase